MIRKSPRKRRVLNLEKLDQRLVLAAPVGNPDTYSVNEDAVLGTGTNAILSAGFNSTPPIVLAQGSTWDYLDKIQNNLGLNQSYPTDDLGRPWNSTNFDLSESTIGPWLSAPAPLAGGVVGQGGGAIIDFFPNAPNVLDGVDDAPNGSDNLVITYLFRRSFTLTAEQAAAPSGTVNVLCDDGCAGYINGVEAFRLNLPAGPLTTGTFAPNSNGAESGMTAIPINLANLNLVAGEQYNRRRASSDANNTSSDVGFEMDLSVGPPATDGFTYGDSVFGTNQPNWESGEHQAAQGFSNTGGLHTTVRRQGGFGRQFGFLGGFFADVQFARAVARSPFRRVIDCSWPLTRTRSDYAQAVLTVDGESSRREPCRPDNRLRRWPNSPETTTAGRTTTAAGSKPRST